MVEVWELCNRLHMLFGASMLLDARWTSAFTRASEEAVRSAREATRGRRVPRVIVLGLGTGCAALSAARAGAEVLWVVRVTRYAEVATRLAERNGFGPSQLRVISCKAWADAVRLLPPMPGGEVAREADVVITEEIGDDPMSEGVVQMARISRQLLLRPNGVFAPRCVRVYGCLASVRSTTACGFDVRGIASTSSSTQNNYSSPSYSPNGVAGAWHQHIQAHGDGCAR
jgi:hypothetical protein